MALPISKYLYALTVLNYWDCMWRVLQFCSYLGGDKHGDAEGDGGEEHEEGGEEGRVGAELGPLGLHDQAVPVRRCGGKGIGYKRNTVFTTLQLTNGHDGHGGHEARHPLAGVGQLAQPLGVLLERPLVASKRHDICYHYQPPLEE